MTLQEVRQRYDSLLQESLNGKPRSYPDELLQEELKRNRKKIIVLDDDPTGVQTVHDVSVYTDWSEESMEEGFAEDRPLFYILTNSRGMTESQTRVLHTEVTRRAVRASRRTGKEFLIISRGDSTLRGHYPLETEVIRQTLKQETGMDADGEVLMPFFAEGGRVTIDNIHYVAQNGSLIPAGETEFAKDATFGYHSSDLTQYIEEKTGGAYQADQVTCISLNMLRGLKLNEIEEALLAVKDFGKVVVNAIDYVDAKIFAVALYRAIARGKYFLFRTAAGFVKAAAGITDQPLLTRKDMITRENGHGGMIIAGSHTGKTTAQLARLRELDGLHFEEFNSDLVLEPEKFEKEIARVGRLCEENITAGITVVVYTKRTLLSLPDDTKEAALLRSVQISEAVLRLVAERTTEPAFIIAKGGITSSDIGVKALKVRRAEVIGQAAFGVPVWRCGPESRFPGIPYIIFPGNVGEEDTLKKVAETLLGRG